MGIRKPMANKEYEDMEIQESLTINDTTYYLKTALLYTGSGSFGHWKVSISGHYLQLATDFIYVHDEGLPKKKPIEIDKNAKDSESEHNSHHEKTQSEVVKSLEEYFSKMMDLNGALSREGETDLRYVLYNDASEPKPLKPNEELGYLQLATDFIYVHDEGLPKKKPIEIDKNAKDSESV